MEFLGKSDGVVKGPPPIVGGWHSSLSLEIPRRVRTWVEVLIFCAQLGSAFAGVAIAPVLVPRIAANAG